MPFDHPFYFLRHGETAWNAEARTQGQLDAPLNERGRAQALAAAEILKGQQIARIIASPLSRASDTARLAAEATGASLSFDDGLMEFHAGDWQGQPRGELIREYFAGTMDPPGGETFPEFAARAWDALERAVAAGPDTLIVCHGGLWYAAQQYTKVEPGLWPMPNALPIHVTPYPDRWHAKVLES
ncbi:MAG: histidine phosphatase family protein [Pseudomonadota bacterium]